MDANLKAALIEKIKAAQEDLKSPRAVKALLEERARQTRKNCAPNAQKTLYFEVRRRLVGFSLLAQKTSEAATSEHLHIEQNNRARGTDDFRFQGHRLPARNAA